MKDLGDQSKNQSGSLLLAHPNLEDPNFVKTVILISAHSPEDGALGVVLNRPLDKFLGEYNDKFSYGNLAEVPLYSGGPVNAGHLILAAWKWEEEKGVFKLFFGLTADKAETMLSEEPGLEVRGFLGYAGWSGGQIENELKQHAWVVSPIDGKAIKNCSGTELWRNILNKINPDLKFLTDAPDDPSVN